MRMRLSNVFDDFFFGYDSLEKREKIKKEGEDLILKIGLPGYKSEEVKVEQEGRKIYIEAEKEGEVYKESYLIPAGYGEEISIKMEYGLLEIVLKGSKASRKRLL